MQREASTLELKTTLFYTIFHLNMFLLSIYTVAPRQNVYNFTTHQLVYARANYYLISFECVLAIALYYDTEINRLHIFN